MIFRWLGGAFFIGVGAASFGWAGSCIALGFVLMLTVISDQIKILSEDDDKQQHNHFDPLDHGGSLVSRFQTAKPSHGNEQKQEQFLVDGACAHLHCDPEHLDFHVFESMGWRRVCRVEWYLALDYGLLHVPLVIPFLQQARFP